MTLFWCLNHSYAIFVCVWIGHLCFQPLNKWNSETNLLSESLLRMAPPTSRSNSPFDKEQAIWKILDWGLGGNQEHHHCEEELQRWGRAGPPPSRSSRPWWKPLLRVSTQRRWRGQPGAHGNVPGPAGQLPAPASRAAFRKFWRV